LSLTPQFDKRLSKAAFMQSPFAPFALTDHHQAGMERLLRNLGASALLTKPFDWKQLQSALQAQLDEKSLVASLKSTTTTTT
jgi:AmiR/NasT family two-component response regulator